jgi:hypothetical protein
MYWQGLEKCPHGAYGYTPALARAMKQVRSQYSKGPFVGSEGVLLYYVQDVAIAEWFRAFRNIVGYVEANMLDDVWIEIRFDARN